MEDGEGISSRSENFPIGKVLRFREGISRVLKGLPHDEIASVGEFKVTGLIEICSSDAAVRGCGFPNGGAGSVGEAEVTVGLELESAAVVHRAGGPDGDTAYVSYSGNKEGRVLWVGDEGERKGVVGGRPGGGRVCRRQGRAYHDAGRSGFADEEEED